MKWFLSVCLVVAGIGIVIASCGPQKDFCPTNPTNPPGDFSCHPNNDAVTGMGGMMMSMCDGPQILCPDHVTIKCSLADCP